MGIVELVGGVLRAPSAQLAPAGGRRAVLATLAKQPCTQAEATRIVLLAVSHVAATTAIAEVVEAALAVALVWGQRADASAITTLVSAAATVSVPAHQIMLYDSALVLAQPGAADDVASAATAAVGASLAPGGNQIECRTAASAAALVLRHGLMLPQPGPTAHALASAFTRWQMLDDNNRPLPDAVADAEAAAALVQYCWSHCPAPADAISTTMQHLILQPADSARQSSPFAYAAVAKHVSAEQIRVLSGTLADVASDDDVSRTLQTLLLWLAWPANAAPADPLPTLPSTTTPAASCPPSWPEPRTRSTAEWLLAAIDALERRDRIAPLAKFASAGTNVALSLAQSRPNDAVLIDVVARLLRGHAWAVPLLRKHNRGLIAIISRCTRPSAIAGTLFGIMQRAPGHPEVYGPLLQALETRDCRPSPLATGAEGDVSEVADRRWVVPGGAFAGAIAGGDPGLAVDDLGSGSTGGTVRSITGLQAQRAGLVNLGNTCYANAAVQALFSLTAFRRGVLACMPGAGGPCTRTTRELFGLLVGSRRRAQRPSAFLAACRPEWFPAGTQQDSGEFLVHWLDQLDRELQGGVKAAKAAKSDVSVTPPRLLTGAMATMIRCLACQRESCRREAFTALPLPITGEGESVQSLLNGSLHAETLTGDNKYACETCGSLQDAVQQSELVTLPPFLIMSLVRFAYDAKTQRQSKVQTNVKLDSVLSVPAAARQGAGFPDGMGGRQLDSSNGTRRYVLAAIIFHSGRSLHSGHYYTAAVHPGEKPDDPPSMVLLNDSNVSPTSLEQLSSMGLRFQQDTAYMLVYRAEDEVEIRPSPEEVPDDLHSAVIADSSAAVRESQRDTSTSRGGFGDQGPDDYAGGGGSGPGGFTNGPRMVF